MNAFPSYLHSQVAEKLKNRHVVVWYDPNREFAPFVDSLTPMEADESGLPHVQVGGIDARLAVFGGSYFALRMTLEPMVSANRPQPLLVYVPGQRRDRFGSLLMELECAGECYEPQLKRHARNVMRKSFSDGVIDEMLASESLGYPDILALLEQDGSSGGSLLKLVYDTRDNVVVAAGWLAKPDSDSVVNDKGAGPELAKLLASRAGFNPGATEFDAGTRAAFARYLLINEFREDLHCAPPGSVAMVPATPLKEQREFREKVLDHLRSREPMAFEHLADEVEAQFGLGSAGIDAADLGRIDTFRFEERAMLRYCAERIAAGAYAEGRELVNIHSQSFWATRDLSRRQAQWEVCSLLAELGIEVERVGAALQAEPASTSSAGLVAAYAAADGWHQVDRAHRRLETRVAQLEEEPEAEEALAVIREKLEDVLRAMAAKFTAAFRRDQWNVSGVLHQTRVYREKVLPQPGRVAWFLIDALRFEMGVDLARQIPEAADMELAPAVAALPSITPLCMAALLPGAAADFSVVESGGKVAARIGSSVLADVNARMRFLRSEVPDAGDISLDVLLQGKPSQVRGKINGCRLLVVRSQEIDSLGEKAELLARNVMDTVIGNIARAVRKLGGLGFNRFIITADHGHQFAGRREEDMKLEAPAGGTIELHRRCWIGRGAAAQPGAVAIPAPALGYDSNLQFVFPEGLGVFKSGGGLAYHHGGFSLQELVIPVLSFRMREAAAPPAVGPKATISNFPLSVTTRTFGVQIELEADLLTTEPIDLRVVLLSRDAECGKAGMAVGAHLDRNTGILRLLPGVSVSVALVVTRDDVEQLRVLVQDAHTGAVLGESPNLPVHLKL